MHVVMVGAQEVVRGPTKARPAPNTLSTRRLASRPSTTAGSSCSSSASPSPSPSPSSSSSSFSGACSLARIHSVATCLLVLLLALAVVPLFQLPLPIPTHIWRLLTHDYYTSSTPFTLRNPIVFQQHQQHQHQHQHQHQPPICPRPKPIAPAVEFIGTFNTRPERSMALADQAKRVAAEFGFESDAVNKAVGEFIREMDEGLAAEGTELSQIPTYVTAVPNGTEKGLYMAVDLGGTNFRVCSIRLNGDTTFSLTQSKVAIPRELMVAKTSKELFAFLAKQIEAFLKQHHEEHYVGTLKKRKTGEEHDEIFNLGFTFSFPVNQIGINKGMLMRWTKGFDIQDAIGKDVCALLQAELDELHLPVKVAALVNDTVGTLMARSYTSPGKTGTLLGAIFGTGTNGAYVEKLDKVTKLTKSNSAGEYDQSTGEMIVNTEWGSFDNSLRTLPNTPYDVELDEKSVNPGIQMFEKRVSGMFLGELLRLALLKLINDPEVPLFTDDNSSSNDAHSTTQIGKNSPIYKQWGIDTSLLSVCAGDSTPGLRMLRQTLDKDYDISAVSAEDAEAVRDIAAAIGRRAARLSAVAIAAIIINTGRLDKSSASGTATTGDAPVNEDDIIDVGVDGSLVEFYPNFEEHIRQAFREMPQIGAQGEKRIRIGIAKDGSGVGAALIALVAGKVAAPEA